MPAPMVFETCPARAHGVRCLPMPAPMVFETCPGSRPRSQPCLISPVFQARASGYRHLDWEQWEQWEHRINRGFACSQPVPSHWVDWEQFKPHRCAKMRLCICLVSGACVYTVFQRG